MTNDQRRYLIVGPSWVGDMVMAQSLFITLKNLYPDCLIDVIAPEWSLPVLERMPQVHEGISLPVSHGEFSLLKRIKKGRMLRDNNYSHAIVLPRSWKSALVPFFAQAKIRTGYRGEMRNGLLNDIRKLDKQMLEQTVQRYVAHAYDGKIDNPPAIPFPVLNTNTANRDTLLGTLNITLDRPVICMMPGAEYGPAKQWPVSYYSELAEKLIASGYQVWVLGSAKESALGEEIAGDKGDSGFNLCGKTQLVDVVDLLSCAKHVVTNDSGLMHMAAAVGITVHVIYGSSTPDYTPPLTGQEKLNVHYKYLECSPCFKRVCPLGHTDCLKSITVDEIYNKVISA